MAGRVPDDQLPEEGAIATERYTKLQERIDDAIHRVGDTEVTAVLLPKGGGARFYEYLTCSECGIFVCYRHNAELRPVSGEPTTMVMHPVWDRPSRKFPTSIIRQFEARLTVE